MEPPIPASPVRRSGLVVGAGLLVVATGALYLALHGETAPGDELAVAVIAATIFAAGGALVVAGLAVSPVVRVVLAAAASGALLVWGVLGLFTIGALWLAGAALALFVAVHAAPSAGRRRWVLAAAAAVAGALAAALAAVFVLQSQAH